MTYLDCIALPKAQAGAIICIVIVECANVHASWRRGGTRIAVHSAGVWMSHRRVPLSKICEAEEWTIARAQVVAK